MSFSVEYGKQPQKFLDRCEKQLAKRIIDKADELLADNPVPSSAKAIVGEHGVFRIRIGDYRALYRINYQENKILIFKIDKRSKVYE